MKHTHWNFKANTETFDGERAVKEAYAAGMQKARRPQRRAAGLRKVRL